MPFQSGMDSGIKILGSHQRSVTLNQADLDFLYYLASMAPQRVPEDALAVDKANFQDKPISCGDYRVMDKTPDGLRYFLEKFRAPADALERVELWNDDFAKLPARPDVMLGGLFPRDKLDPSYRPEWTQQPTQVFTFVLHDKAPIVQFPAFRGALNLDPVTDPESVSPRRPAGYLENTPTLALGAKTPNFSLNVALTMGHRVLKSLICSSILMTKPDGTYHQGLKSAMGMFYIDLRS